MPVEDIDTAEKICSEDISHLKGKTTTRNPTTTNATAMTIPKEFREKHENITSHMDTMHIEKIGFMTTISHPLHCRGCTHLEDHMSDTFCKNTVTKPYSVGSACCISWPEPVTI